MKGLNLDQLQTFADVVDFGSFSAAADHAGISQPAVSLQVRQLERRLGVRLVERVGRRAQPTAAGADLLLHARRIAEEAARALETIAPHRSGQVGRVRLGTGATACIYLLPPILRRLRTALPGLDITVRTGNTSDVLRLLEANALDIALVTLPVAGRSIQVTKLYDDELVAVFPAEAGPPAGPVTPAYLADRPLIFYEGGGNTRRIADQWFARAGYAPKPAMELGSVEAIKQLIGAGLGWAVLPELAVRGVPAASSVAACSLSPRLHRSLGLVLRKDKHLGYGLREVIRAVSESLEASEQR